MPFTAKDVRQSLTKKGFAEDPHGGHHRYFYHVHNGRRTGPYTYVSHGSSKEDLGPDIVRKMKKQLHLGSSQEVRDLVQCRMSGDDFLASLVRQGVIDGQT